ncbi:MAG TPA: hypothetical protein VG652_00390 [Gaiellaceae bacterium]|nr:hypothetical protein [Gaiellaceae bacterium]
MLQLKISAGLAALAATAVCVSAAGAQPAPAAPTAVTGSATPLTTKMATVGGTLSSNGAPTTYSFEYGPTTSYGAQTRTRNAGPHASNISFTFNLSGLTPGTLYHYALVATNSAGTTTGSDETFTTLAPPPPVVSTGASSNVTVKTAVLSGTVNAGGAPTTFFFQYGATSSYGAQSRTKNAGAGTSDRAVSVSLSGLTSGTVYHYRIVASNSAGTTNGDDETFTTTAAPPPAAVTGGPAAIAPKTARVTGTVTPNGAATTYDFEYGATTSYGAQTPSHYAGAGLKGIPVTAVLSGLTPGQTYHFRLVATSSSGTTDGSDQTVTATAAPAPRAAHTNRSRG